MQRQQKTQRMKKNNARIGNNANIKKTDKNARNAKIAIS